MTALNFAYRREGRFHAAALARSTAACPDRSPVVVVRLTRALWAPVGLELRLAVEALLRCGQRRVLLDLRDLTRIDAAGTGELARAFTAMRAAGGSLEIAHASDRVRRVLSMVGLLAVLSSVPEG